LENFKLSQEYKNRIPRIVIAGGSFSGVELATNIVNYMGRDKVLVTLITDEILENALSYNRQCGIKALKNCAVDILTNTRVKSVAEGKIFLAKATKIKDIANNYGNAVGNMALNDDLSMISGNTLQNQMVVEEPTTLNSDLMIWTGGVKTNSVISRLPLNKDSRGRLITDPFLRVKGSERIFALGDNAVIEGQGYKSTAQVAKQQANIAAWNIWGTISGKKLLAFKNSDFGEMLSYGKKSSFSMPSPIIRLNGRLAKSLRRLVYATSMPTNKQSAKSVVSWLAAPLRKTVHAINGGCSSI